MHRNSPDDTENKKLFYTKRHVLTINEAKDLFKETLTLRMTITEDKFPLNEYAEHNIPLYINPMIPATPKSMAVFKNVKDKLTKQDETQYARRNAWLNLSYNNIPVRVAMGDRVAHEQAGRKPVFVNVAIVHRTGIISGSWYETDKVLYKPEFI